jgi:hypothetical protein
MEETEVDLKVPHDPVSQMEALMEFQKTGKKEKKKINTKHILFIMSGAFNGLEEIVKKRLNRQEMGFRAEIKSKDEGMEYLQQVKSEDLIQYGFESEFIGRLPVVTVFEHLEVADLYNILRNPKSPIIISKKRDFKAYGIDLQFEDEALRRIAENAFLERTGARGLVSAVEKVLIKFEHALPSTDIHRLAVTAAMVADPAGELEKILRNPNDPEQKTRFQTLVAEEERELEESVRLKENELLEGYGIYFSDHRRKLVTRRTIQGRMDLDSVVEDLVAVRQAALDFAQAFSARNEVQFGFAEEAIDLFAEKVWREGVDAGEVLKQSYHNYDHGLKLIREKTGVREFLVPPEGIENPDGYLNQMIREIYKEE